MLNSFKQKINIKYSTAVYLAVLLIYAGFSFTIPLNLLNSLGIIFLYIVFDLLWVFIRKKVWYLPVSSVISACILGLVALPNPPLIWVALLPFLAVFSKRLLHLGKIRHIFNPAAFALAIASIFFPAVTWWGTGWDLNTLIVIAIFSVFIIWKQNRFHLVLSFLLSYTVFLSIYLLYTGVSISALPNILNAQLVNGTTLFFISIMLIEPLTSAFSTLKQRVVYAILVALFAILVSLFLRVTHFPHQDNLIWGLLLGNLTAGLLFLPNKQSKPL